MTDAPAQFVRGEAKRLDRSLVVLAAFLGIGVGFPSVYSSTATVFILPLSQAFGWGRAIPSLMYLAGTGGMALAAIYLGKLIERWGAPRVAALSGLALAIVLALLGRQGGSPVEAVALCFLGGLLGAGTGAGLWLSVPPSFFDAYLGRVLGLVALGQSAGMALLPALASGVIGEAGWRTAYLVLAGVSLVITALAALLLFWVLRRQTVTTSVPGRASSADGVRLAAAIRTRLFWVIAVITLLICLGVVGASIHIFPLYADRGVARSSLPLVGLALGLGTMVGRITSGFALDRFRARDVAMGLFILGALGTGWLATLRSHISMLDLLIPPALIGMALGAESDILAFLVRRSFGLVDLPVIYNRLLIAFYVGAVTGTMMVGVLADAGYDMALGIGLLCASCIAAAALTRLLPALKGEAAY